MAIKDYGLFNAKDKAIGELARQAQWTDADQAQFLILEGKRREWLETQRKAIDEITSHLACSDEALSDAHGFVTLRVDYVAKAIVLNAERILPILKRLAGE